MRIGAVAALAFLSGCATVLPPAAPSLGTPKIRIAAAPAGDWTVRYELDAPARRIAFMRSPDDSRSKRWKAAPEFEIVSTAGGEIARRRDGAPFRSVSFAVTPAYVELPKDYAPFSPFGDGSMLFHTGRFFACAESCALEGTRWSMHLAVPEGRSILLDGERRAGPVAWIDADSGRNIYVGDTRPVETPDLLAVIDRSLPPAIHAELVEQLPSYMRFFAARLGELPERPMLFASYDASHPNRFGRQGGTLPGQVFTHFYGSKWPVEMAKPNFGNDLAWHFAHEAAHLYQRQIFSPEPTDAWIHEGAAEAFAALAMRESDPSADPYVASRIDAARAGCAKDRGGKTVRDAVASGNFSAAYSCGLLLNLLVDAEVRRISPESDGLYAVWRDYIARVERQGGRAEADYLASVAAVGTPALADTLRRAVRSENPDLGRVTA